MECAPAPSVVVVKVAVPPASVLTPRDVAPSRKVTLPAGVPPADAETVAVKVMEAPKMLGLPDVDTVLVEAAGVTLKDRETEAAAAKLALPACEAVIEQAPTVRIVTAPPAVTVQMAVVGEV